MDGKPYLQLLMKVKREPIMTRPENLYSSGLATAVTACQSGGAAGGIEGDWVDHSVSADSTLQEVADTMCAGKSPRQEIQRGRVEHPKDFVAMVVAKNDADDAQVNLSVLQSASQNVKDPVKGILPDQKVDQNLLTGFRQKSTQKEEDVPEHMPLATGGIKEGDCFDHSVSADTTPQEVADSMCAGKSSRQVSHQIMDEDSRDFLVVTKKEAEDEPVYLSVLQSANQDQALQSALTDKAAENQDVPVSHLELTGVAAEQQEVQSNFAGIPAPKQEVQVIPSKSADMPAKQENVQVFDWDLTFRAPEFEVTRSESAEMAAEQQNVHLVRLELDDILPEQDVQAVHSDFRTEVPAEQQVVQGCSCSTAAKQEKLDFGSIGAATEVGEEKEEPELQVEQLDAGRAEFREENLDDQCNVDLTMSSEEPTHRWMHDELLDSNRRPGLNSSSVQAARSGSQQEEHLETREKEDKSEPLQEAPTESTAKPVAEQQESELCLVAVKRILELKAEPGDQGSCDTWIPVETSDEHYITRVRSESLTPQAVDQDRIIACFPVVGVEAPSMQCFLSKAETPSGVADGSQDAAGEVGPDQEDSTTISAESPLQPEDAHGECESTLELVMRVLGTPADAPGIAEVFPGKAGVVTHESFQTLCSKCRKPEGPRNTIICDKCDRSFHTGCANIDKRAAIRSDEWLCPSCLVDGGTWRWQLKKIDHVAAAEQSPNGETCGRLRSKRTNKQATARSPKKEQLALDSVLRKSGTMQLRNRRKINYTPPKDFHFERSREENLKALDSHVAKKVVDSHLAGRVVGSHVSERAADSQVAERVPDSHVAEGILDSHVPERILDSHVAKKVLADSNSKDLAGKESHRQTSRCMEKEHSSQGDDSSRFSSRSLRMLEAQALERLRAYIAACNGALDDGWTARYVKVKNNTSVQAHYYSPSLKRFQSRVEVARSLGLVPGAKNRWKKIINEDSGQELDENEAGCKDLKRSQGQSKFCRSKAAGPTPETALEGLRSFIYQMNGNLGEGWTAHIEPKTHPGGRIHISYTSPCSMYFRTKAKVAEFLGIEQRTEDIPNLLSTRSGESPQLGEGNQPDANLVVSMAEDMRSTGNRGDEETARHFTPDPLERSQVLAVAGHQRQSSPEQGNECERPLEISTGQVCQKTVIAGLVTFEDPAHVRHVREPGSHSIFPSAGTDNAGVKETPSCPRNGTEACDQIPYPRGFQDISRAAEESAEILCAELVGAQTVVICPDIQSRMENPAVSTDHLGSCREQAEECDRVVLAKPNAINVAATNAVDSFIASRCNNGNIRLTASLDPEHESDKQILSKQESGNRLMETMVVQPVGQSSDEVLADTDNGGVKETPCPRDGTQACNQIPYPRGVHDISMAAKESAEIPCAVLVGAQKVVICPAIQSRMENPAVSTDHLGSCREQAEECDRVVLAKPDAINVAATNAVDSFITSRCNDGNIRLTARLDPKHESDKQILAERESGNRLMETKVVKPAGQSSDEVLTIKSTAVNSTTPATHTTGEGEQKKIIERIQAAKRQALLTDIFRPLKWAKVVDSAQIEMAKVVAESPQSGHKEMAKLVVAESPQSGHKEMAKVVVAEAPQSGHKEIAKVVADPTQSGQKLTAKVVAGSPTSGQKQIPASNSVSASRVASAPAVVAESRTSTSPGNAISTTVEQEKAVYDVAGEKWKIEPSMRVCFCTHLPFFNRANVLKADSSQQHLPEKDISKVPAAEPKTDAIPSEAEKRKGRKKVAKVVELQQPPELPKRSKEVQEVPKRMSIRKSKRTGSAEDEEEPADVLTIRKSPQPELVPTLGTRKTTGRTESEVDPGLGKTPGRAEIGQEPNSGKRRKRTSVDQATKTVGAESEEGRRTEALTTRAKRRGRPRKNTGQEQLKPADESPPMHIVVPRTAEKVRKKPKIAPAVPLKGLPQRKAQHLLADPFDHDHVRYYRELEPVDLPSRYHLPAIVKEEPSYFTDLAEYEDRRHDRGDGRYKHLGAAFPTRTSRGRHREELHDDMDDAAFMVAEGRSSREHRHKVSRDEEYQNVSRGRKERGGDQFRDLNETGFEARNSRYRGNEIEGHHGQAAFSGGIGNMEDDSEGEQEQSAAAHEFGHVVCHRNRESPKEHEIRRADFVGKHTRERRTRDRVEEEQEVRRSPIRKHTTGVRNRMVEEDNEVLGTKLGGQLPYRLAHGSTLSARGGNSSGSDRTLAPEMEEYMDRKSTEAMDQLRAFVARYGGVLEKGWKTKVTMRKRTGCKQMDITFVSPGGEIFRSKLEVGRQLGLLAGSDSRSQQSIR